MEEWRDIEGFESLYQVSSKGSVRAKNRTLLRNSTKRTIKIHLSGHLMSTNIDPNGYRYVGLSKGGKVKFFKVHQLVAKAFIPNDEGYNEVNHKDGNKCNNDVSNLEWCTHKYNMQHAVRTGLLDPEKARMYHYRRIAQIDVKTDKIIKIWNTIKEAAESLSKSKYAPMAIWRCLKGKNTSNTSYGYKWQYVK